MNHDHNNNYYKNNYKIVLNIPITYMDSQQGIIIWKENYVISLLLYPFQIQYFYIYNKF